jgi:hypothetical protein
LGRRPSCRSLALRYIAWQMDLMESYELCVAPAEAVADEEETVEAEAERVMEGGDYASRMRLLSACGLCDGDACRPLHLTANPVVGEVDRVLVVLALCAAPFHTCPGAHRYTLVIVRRTLEAPECWVTLKRQALTQERARRTSA